MTVSTDCKEVVRIVLLCFDDGFYIFKSYVNCKVDKFYFGFGAFIARFTLDTCSGADIICFNLTRVCRGRKST